jgi:hypothetical protein
MGDNILCAKDMLFMRIIFLIVFKNLSFIGELIIYSTKPIKLLTGKLEIVFYSVFLLKKV